MIHRTKILTPEETRLIEGDAFRAVLADISENGSGQAKDAAKACVSCPCSPEDCLFFDIETTGLSADTSFIFLIGAICFNDNTWILHQFLIQTVQEESLLLSSFFELTGHCQILVHFNGNTFDLPFIRKRAAANGRTAPFEGLFSLDLYQHVRPLKQILSLPHMNQSYLEKYIGWEREDHLNGKEVVSLFWSYSSAKDPETEQLLLCHNHDDLLGMIRIPALEGYFALLKGPIQSNTLRVCESDDLSCLLFRFSTILPIPHPFEFFRNDSFRLQADKNSGRISVPIYSGTLRYYFPDYKNYYYLPVEKQVIHKSVGSYVAKEFRTSASPENCFAARTGRFLPQPEILFTPAFRKEYRSKELFFEYTESFCEQKENAANYVRRLLSSLL
ncbi:MAG: ribonuclease H-like domain-containing protein [Lachnospiraceae bacterium]|nr:ribonuclease H-like domain-containing protein [Lachnospiraceae bacterium]